MRLFILFTLLWMGNLLALDAFQIQGEFQAPDFLKIHLQIPPNGYLYASLLEAVPSSGKLVPLPDNPPPVQHHADSVYKTSGTLRYKLSDFQFPLTVTVYYQGCVSGLCYLPAQKVFTFNDTGAEAENTPSNSTPTFQGDKEKIQRWKQLSASMQLTGTFSGFLSAQEFTEFLQKSIRQNHVMEAENLLLRVFHKHGLVLAALLLLPLGMLLNLTPCVLPMIPVNLSILGIGAGTTKAKGCILGSLYGGAMAAAYGILGILAVLTGQRFGSLNTSPWFNFGIAVVFILLCLSLFDVFFLDLSKFRRKTPKNKRLPYFSAIVLGAVSALLAGACIAPVLIWVLLLATDLYAQGKNIGLVLPLILGIGMALPWPLLGAGIAFLPKPGMWMERLKRGIGILIFGFALYYAYLGVSLMGIGQSNQTAKAPAGWETDLITAAEQAQLQQKPLLLYFWGVTCKSCTLMKKTTFPKPDVQGALSDFIPVAIQADNLQDPFVPFLLEQFKIPGMPTFLILQNKN